MASSSQTTKIKPVRIAGVLPKDGLSHISHFTETISINIFLWKYMQQFEVVYPLVKEG